MASKYDYKVVLIGNYVSSTSGFASKILMTPRNTVCRVLPHRLVRLYKMRGYCKIAVSCHFFVSRDLFVYSSYLKYSAPII